MTRSPKPKRNVFPLAFDHRPNPPEVIVTMYPNGTIGFRRSRTRTEYVIPLDNCYSMAVKADATSKAIEAKKARLEQRKERTLR